MEDKNYDSSEDTLKHIFKVNSYLKTVSDNITQRGLVHDKSKLENPEKEAFDESTPKLRNLVYGTEEYKQSLIEIQPAINHHYSKNAHHPEYTRINELEWKKIWMYEDYEISNFGEIRLSNNKSKISYDNMIVELKKDSNFLRRLNIKHNDFGSNGFFVAEAFVPNAKNKRYILHKNGNVKDNYWKNLKWTNTKIETFVPSGLSDLRFMSLFDLIEMLADWKAAGERHKTGSMEHSLEVNKKRFNIPSELQDILENTAKELDWI